MRIAFQGEPGAFSEEAALKIVPDARTAGYETFDEAVEAAQGGAADAVCMPVENSLYGPIGRSYDLIDRANLHIVAEHVMHVRQCLIGRPGLLAEQVKTVASHPVALEQCRNLFRRYPWMRPHVAHDTAGAVRAMLDGKLDVDACIASPFAAQRYSGTVLLYDVHDDPANFTRFFLARTDAAAAPPESAARATIAFEIADRPGGLRDALAVFSDRGQNLRLIVSRPVPSQPWIYRFYVEVDTPLAGAVDAVDALSEHGHARLLGCYPAPSES